MCDKITVILQNHLHPLSQISLARVIMCHTKKSKPLNSEKDGIHFSLFANSIILTKSSYYIHFQVGMLGFRARVWNAQTCDSVPYTKNSSICMWHGFEPLILLSASVRFTCQCYACPCWHPCHLEVGSVLMCLWLPSDFNPVLHLHPLFWILWKRHNHVVTDKVSRWKHSRISSQPTGKAHECTCFKNASQRNLPKQSKNWSPMEEWMSAHAGSCGSRGQRWFHSNLLPCVPFVECRPHAGQVMLSTSLLGSQGC